MIFNFRKIASVLTSTVMLSSTIALAAAASFPAPFVQNGGANVAVVYGQTAANSDLVAVADITRQLQLELAKQTAPSGKSGSSTSVSGGDYVKLAKTGDNLNLRDSISTVYGSTLTDVDLPVLLEDGKYVNDENSDFDYEQRITLGSSLRTEFFSDSDYKDRTPTIGVNLSTNMVVTNYSLEFTDDPDSDVTGGDLVDLETTTIKMLGKEYYISDADNATLSFILLDTANSGNVAEGETTTITVGSKSYDVSIDFIGSSEVKLKVNGQTTNSLSEGGTFKLTDGTYVGIKDISVQDYAGGIKKVEFSLGSGKLELRNAQSIRVNDDSIPEVTTEVVRGSPASGKEKIDRINLVWTTDEDSFITPDTELIMPGFANLKFSMGPFFAPAQEVTTVREGASDYMTLTTTLKDGEVTIPLLYANTNGNFTGIGKGSSDKLVTSNGNRLIFNYSGGDRTFVASYNTSNYAESYYLQFTGFTNDNGINKTTVQKRSGGSWVDACTDRRAGDTCTIGSLTLTLSQISAHPDRTVNLSGNAGATFDKAFTKTGLRIQLPYGNETLNTTSSPGDGAITFNLTDANMGSVGHYSGSFWLFIAEEDRTDSLGAGTKFNATLADNSDNEVEVTGISTGRSTITDPKDSDLVESMIYSDLATKVELVGKSSDQRDARVTYGGSESYAEVFLSTKDAVTSSTSGNTTTTTTSTGAGVKELGSISVSDGEAASVASKNLIVVGGSCVNSVAASLLGGAFCTSDFEKATGVGAGSFLIQTFSRTGGTVATLVAGYNAGDTTNAAKFLITNSVDTSVGKKYKSTSATTASLVTVNSTATA